MAEVEGFEALICLVLFQIQVSNRMKYCTVVKDSELGIFIG